MISFRGGAVLLIFVDQITEIALVDESSQWLLSSTSAISVSSQTTVARVDLLLVSYCI